MCQDWQKFCNARIADANYISDNTAFSPFVASSMLLKALEREFPAWVEVKKEKYLMQDRANTKLKLDDFLSLRRQAIDEGCHAAE